MYGSSRNACSGSHMTCYWLLFGKSISAKVLPRPKITRAISSIVYIMWVLEEGDIRMRLSSGGHHYEKQL